jgi:molybdate transport system substrate-binding protein
MRMRSLSATATIGVVLLLAQGIGANAAEVKVVCSNAVRSVLNELTPRFERDTGHKLVMKFGLSGTLKREIEAGEPFDVAILPPDALSDLAKQGKVAAGSQAEIGRSGIGVLVRAGAPKPDISSAEAFKRTLLEAKSITYAGEGATGMFLPRLFERLGIADAIKAKTKVQTVAGRAQEAVAAGEAELALASVSALTEAPEDAVLLGPLPSELQHYNVFAGAVGAAAKEPDAGKALISFLTGLGAASVLKAKGMEPAAR